jgi:hypothetical protein
VASLSVVVIAVSQTPCFRYKANLLKRPRRGVEDDANQDANKAEEGAGSSSDSDAPISRAGNALFSSCCFLSIRHIMLRPQRLLWRSRLRLPLERAPTLLAPA